MRRVNPGDRIIAALDVSTRSDILRLAETLAGTVGWLKIGLQAFVSTGPALVRELVAGGHRIFLDLKFHDIPNTAANAVAEAVKLGVAMTNVHAAGGSAMLRACSGAKGDAILLAVTILTSMSEAELPEVGFSGGAEENVVRLAKLTRECGLDGVVASPREIRAIRSACGDDFVIVTPGIRPPGAPLDDQRRTLTPAEALAAGATYMVIGRPITTAPDPRAAALRIAESMA